MKKLSLQKMFNFVSFLFIMSCCVFYGTRFIKLYLENKKVESVEEATLAKELKEKNQENNNFKMINGSNYFINKEENNYLEYSNILWRIIRVNGDNSIDLVSDSSLTSIAYGKYDYGNSYVYRWLNNTNDDYTGILENVLNKKEEYLTKLTTCVDKVDTLSNNPCTSNSSESYIVIPSIIDYLNIGSKDSYINTSEYFYLSNSNSEDKIWFVNNEGNAILTNGTDGYGIKAMIRLKANIKHTNGDGSKNNPYKIENENGLFGSYVKLGNDLWRIYKINDNDVRLVLNDYLKVNGDNYSSIYSNNSSYHNDYKNGSIAYYLNHDYLNSLSYKDIINEVDWTNGYYGSSFDNDYKYSINKTIKSKVTMQSVGDIILNNDLFNYMLMTGNKENGAYIYSFSNDKKLTIKSISQKLLVVPTISIEKDKLNKGNGTYDIPYEME